ncbi:MAG: phosphoribosylglycinamide formyltransferase [Proteobacteria bacterium]|nr:phosphoribosylglycinamide formyltransferase [Pseudomonadota bacterium]MBS0464603.1 phosphoribosylglycinamide formyltransferase [Pseudomonadota bacterium]
MHESRVPSPESRPFRVAVLASGRGSNLQALLDAAPTRGFAIVGVFSDHADAPALARARAAGVPAIARDPKAFATREAFDTALFDAIDAVMPDLVVCAGYLRILSDAAVLRHAGRIVNIHPSLLPKYPGLRTHARALAAGDTEHGASVHYVIPALDAGPLIAQARLPILPGDTPTTLAERLLPREHRLLVEAVTWIAAGRILQRGSAVLLDSRPLRAPLRLGAGDHLIEPAETPSS